MEINSLNLTLENIISRAKVLQWCMTFGCTTCGAHKFRAVLKNSFTRDQLIEELKKLSAECVDDVTNRDVLILLMHDVVFLENFTGLSSELAGTNAGKFLDRAVRIEHERRLDTKIRIENEQIAKKMKDKKMLRKIYGAQ